MAWIMTTLEEQKFEVVSHLTWYTLNNMLNIMINSTIVRLITFHLLFKKLICLFLINLQYKSMKEINIESILMVTETQIIIWILEVKITFDVILWLAELLNIVNEEILQYLIFYFDMFVV